MSVAGHAPGRMATPVFKLLGGFARIGRVKIPVSRTDPANRPRVACRFGPA